MTKMADIIEPIVPALRRYARLFMHDACAADDLVQETLERAISRSYQRRTNGNPRTWLFTILHNLALDHLRRSARRGWALPLNDANASELAMSSTQEDAPRHDDILAALEKLPDRQRSILLLISVGDVSYADAARILDIPIGTVMSHLAGARALLLKLIEDQGKPSDRLYLRRVP